jgi:hypothetical protein
MLSFEKKNAFKKIISTFLKNNRISVEAAKVVLNGIYHACLLLGSDVDALEEFLILMYEICKRPIKLFDMV